MPGERKIAVLYGDASQAARTVRAAIYDGPFDRIDYTAASVIFENLANQATGEVSLQPVQAAPNDLIIDSQGNLANLAEGVSYFPSGCSGTACAQILQRARASSASIKWWCASAAAWAAMVRSAR